MNKIDLLVYEMHFNAVANASRSNNIIGKSLYCIHCVKCSTETQSKHCSNIVTYAQARLVHTLHQYGSYRILWLIECSGVIAIGFYFVSQLFLSYLSVWSFLRTLLIIHSLQWCAIILHQCRIVLVVISFRVFNTSIRKEL